MLGEGIERSYLYVTEGKEIDTHTSLMQEISWRELTFAMWVFLWMVARCFHSQASSLWYLFLLAICSKDLELTFSPRVLEGLDRTQSDYNHQQKQDTRWGLPLAGGERNGYTAWGTFEGEKKWFREGAPWEFFFYAVRFTSISWESRSKALCLKVRIRDHTNSWRKSVANLFLRGP